jgi:hypothetical protein
MIDSEWETHPLSGRDLAAASGVPFWSPDSHFIGYWYERKIWKIEATGGTPQSVVEYNGLWGGGAWNQDDLIVYGDRRVGLFPVPAEGGVPVQITALDPVRHETSQYCPSFLPDGKRFVYIRGSTDEGKSAIYVGSLDARPEQQSTKPLVVSNSQPVYAPSAEPDMGYLLFVQGTRLMAQRFDTRRLELKGRAGRHMDRPGCRSRFLPPSLGSAASAAWLGFRLRHVDVEGSSIEFASVQPGNGLVRLAIVAHLDESEASGAAGFAICDHVDAVDGAVRLEHGANCVFGSPEAEITYKDICHLVFFLELAAQRIEGQDRDGFPDYARDPNRRNCQIAS